MSAATLHELNQRYVRLTDRCRSQWTFYQFLQGLFKHLRGAPCPIEIDFQALFSQLRELAQGLGSAQTARTEKVLGQLAARLDEQAKGLLAIDAELSPSLLRRFFDKLRTQDEKVLLAILKFYLETNPTSESTLDKVDILLTRLTELPRENGHSLVRSAHEIERLVQPLLQFRAPAATPEQELAILLGALSDLKTEVLGCKTFADLAGGGALDRFRTLKRRLGDKLLHPRLLPAVVETTVAIKNRFRELWEDEETQLLDDTNRVMELKRQLASHPELLTPELREALETFASVHRRFDQGRQEENVRRDDVLQLRRTLNRILEQFDSTMTAVGSAGAPAADRPAAVPQSPGAAPSPRAPEGTTAELTRHLPTDPLLQEYLSKIMFVLELVGRDRSPSEAARAKELSTLSLEPWEVEAGQNIMSGTTDLGTLAGEMQRLWLHAAALRVRLDEEAKEIDRLQRRGSERLAEVLERGTQSLQRAAELERRFQWFIDDALYRGATEPLERLYRSRFRLLHAYAGLWLIHNERGGISPF